MGFDFSLNFLFSNLFIPPWLSKNSNFWCSDKWKMDFQVKKLKIDISTTSISSQAKLSPVPVITPNEEINYSFPQLRKRTKKTYFKMYCFKSTFLKDMEQKNALFVERSFWWLRAKHLVTTITEFLSLFVNVIIA